MNRSEIFDVVKSHMLEVIMDLDETVEIEETDSMRDLGADSLDVAEIVNDSMKELQVTAKCVRSVRSICPLTPPGPGRGSPNWGSIYWGATRRGWVRSTASWTPR